MANLTTVTAEERKNLEVLIEMLIKPGEDFSPAEFTAAFEFCLSGPDGRLHPQAKRLYNPDLPLALVSSALGKIDPRLATDDAIKNFDRARKWAAEQGAEPDNVDEEDD